MPDSKYLKEKNDIKDKIMDRVKNGIYNLSEANTQSVIKAYLENNTDIEDPELLASLLDEGVLKVAEKIDLNILREIDELKNLPELDNLASYISIANEISSAAEKIKNAAQIVEEFNCSNDLQKQIDDKEKLLKNAKGKKRNELMSEIQKLRDDKHNIDQGWCMKFLDGIAEVTSKAPIIGSAYKEIISKIQKPVSSLAYVSHNRESLINQAIEWHTGGKPISDEEFDARVKNGTIYMGDPVKRLKEIEELNKLSSLFNFVKEKEKIQPTKEGYSLISDYDSIKLNEDILRAYPEIWKHIKSGAVIVLVDKENSLSGYNHRGAYNAVKDIERKSEIHYNPNWRNPNKFDPLVVDLENDGFDMANIDNGVNFDLDGDRIKEKTTWTSKKDGFLSIDLNDNGKIDNGAELFGDTFMLADGKYAKSAIEALTSLDKNRDGVIDAKDEAYSKLRIWKDENGNGISEVGELKSLEDYNITSINIADVKDEKSDINGSTLEKTISFERQAKIVENNVEKTVTSKGKIGEFLLERDIIDSIDEDILSTIPKDDAQSQAIIERIKKLPNIRALGKVGSLHNEMLLDKSGELLGLVEKFVNSTDTEEKDAILDKILIKLGKAENISDKQSGSHINGKFVKVMETFLGRELEKGNLGYIEGNTYRALYGDLKLVYYSLLTFESVFKDMQDAFNIEDNKLVNIKAFNRYIRLATMADIKNAGNIFDSASRVLLYLKSIGIEGFDEFKDYFGNISSGYIDRIGKLNYKRFTGTDKSETMYAYGKGSTIIAGDGDDKIEESMGALTGDDYFYGGKGNDNIYGSLGSDTYVFNLGDGQDIIRENVDGKDKNVIALGKGITKDNIIFKRINETDLEIKVRGTDDKITVKGQFGIKSAINKVYFYDGGSLTDANIKEILTHITNGDDYIKFDNKDNCIDLLDGDDVAFAGKGNDTIACGKGNDVLNAGDGNNTFIYNVGDGHDIISAGLYGYNKIVFGKGIKKEDLIIAHTRIPESRMGISEVTIAFKNNKNDSLKISSQQHSPIISLLQFADGSTMDYKEMKEMFSKPSILDDFIEGTSQADTLYGFEGNDSLRGYSGDDIIYGGLGDDLLNGGAGDDIIDGGIGNDTLYGEGGNDTYIFGRGYGVDRINDIGWNEKDDKDTILFKEGITKDDLIFTRTASSVLEIKIKDTDDKIILENLFDSRHGVEQLKFSDGSIYKLKDIEKELSIIRGTSGDDQLRAFDSRGYILQGYDGNDDIGGSYSDDILDGGSGNDRLVALRGDDILDGGTGDDYLQGEGGNDTYVFGRGYGVDRICDLGWNEKDDKDTILFKEGITKDDLEFTRTASDVLEIKIKDTNDKIILERLFDAKNGVEQFKFADGTVYKLKDLEKELSVIRGTVGDDKLSAFDGRNFTLQGYDGNDEIRGSYGDDILDGATGNDSLYGGGGNDTYIFGRGYGIDTIYDDGGKLDTIEFKEGISMDDLEFVRISSDVGEIRIKNSEDKIVLRRLFDDSERVEQLRFADGTTRKLEDIRKKFAIINGTDKAEELIAYDSVTGYTIYAGGGNDSIYGGSNNDVIYGQEGYDSIRSGAGDDILEGGAGNDYLSGGAGNDTYVFGRGDGVDIIDDSEGGLDTILFKEGISKEDLIIRRTGAEEGEIRIKDSNDRIILKKLFNDRGGVEQLKFSDGSIYKFDDYRKELNELIGTDGADSLIAFNGEGYKLQGGAGNDYLQGGAGDDTYIFGRGDGVDTIQGSGGGLDTILFKEGIKKEDLIIRRTWNNEAEIRIKDTNDKIILRNLYDKKNGVNQLKFSDGSIYKIADLREEFATTRGSASHENLYAYDEEVGNTVYAGGGDDTIYGSKNADKIYGEEGNDCILAKAGDDYLYGGLGNDSLQGEEGNDVLEGGVGNDALYGGAGNDTYIFGRGDGVDTINDYGNNENDDKDTILFKEGITKEDLVIRRTGRDEAEIRIKDTNDKIVLRDLFDKANGVEQLKFSDGSIYKIADLREEFATTRGSASHENLYAHDEEVGNIVYAGGGDDTIYGSKKGDKLYGQEGDDYIEGGAGNDVLYGGAGNDSIYGQEGDDYLEGGAGNDYLNGGAGNDTYVFSKGDGKDTIYDQDSNPNNKDRIQLGYDILNTVFKRDGSNLCIGFADSTDTITINNWYSGSSYQIEEIKSSDNRSITNVQLQLMIDAMAAYTKEKGIDWNTAVKQNPNEVNNILQNFWVANSN